MTGGARRRLVDALLDEDQLQVALLAELGVATSALVHELRQPMFSISAIAQLLLPKLDGVEAERVRELLTQARYAERLLEHYASFGRTDGPDVVLDLNDAVRAALEMVGHRARRQGVAVVVDLGPGTVLLRARRVAVTQVVVNLVNNALDAVEGLATRRVEVRTRKDDGLVRLLVVDTGPGLAADIRDQAFEPFVTTKPAGRGTGLGLAITRDLIEEAGGSVALLAGSSDGQGGGTVAEARWPSAG